MLIGCDITPKAQSDYTELALSQTIDSIKLGLLFATQRVGEWRDKMHLNYINAGFIGKELIKDRKGTISYYFYEENVTKNLIRMHLS